jgi:hypothetical protein
VVQTFIGAKKINQSFNPFVSRESGKFDERFPRKMVQTIPTLNMATRSRPNHDFLTTPSLYLTTGAWLGMVKLRDVISVDGFERTCSQ